jgi:DNA-binding NarL/FixJ family response regulator
MQIVGEADSVISGLDIINQMKPDLIFLDILLKGHSAFALLNELQSYADTVKIPVVVCSNLSENLDESALKNYGVVGILDKSTARPREILEACQNATK